MTRLQATFGKSAPRGQPAHCNDCVAGSLKGSATAIWVASTRVLRRVLSEFQPNVLRAMFSTIRHRAVLRQAGAEPHRFLTKLIPIALSVRTVAQNVDISKRLGRVEIYQATIQLTVCRPAIQ